MKHYVIIGNGVAAVGCIEGIRSVDNEGEITVVSKENHPVYCRPLISYYLEGKTDIEKMDYRKKTFYEDEGCRVIYGKSAVKTNPETHTVTLDDDSTLDYTELCVAAGSTPFVPPFDGLDKVSKRFSFMTLDDTLDLEKAIATDSRVLIIGAGLIGLKCAEGLHGRVGSITVCDLADRILSSIFDRDAASIMQRHLEENGISFMLSDSVSRFEDGRAYMKSGKTVDFDILVTAVGVRANTSLLSDTGAEINRGIVVDDRMMTGAPHIYAAGDCAEGYDSSFGARRVLAILPNAYMQGRCAGINMAGGESYFDNAIPMNSIGFFGLHAMTAGSYFTEGSGCHIYSESEGKNLRKFFVKDGVLCGYMLLGKVDRAGIYTALIREKTPLDTVDFEILQKNPTFAAFSSKNRRQKFGGVV